jgi:hypothetical protein
MVNVSQHPECVELLTAFKTISKVLNIKLRELAISYFHNTMRENGFAFVRTGTLGSDFDDRIVKLPNGYIKMEAGDTISTDLLYNPVEDAFTSNVWENRDISNYFIVIRKVR